jgi:hypothetical protein
MHRWARVGNRSPWRARLAGGAVGALMIANVAASPAPQATTWTVAAAANATVTGGQLVSVACTAADACTAVGTEVNRKGIHVILAERWNGTGWQRQTTPNPPNRPDINVFPQLTGVSCPVSDFCVAVGSHQKNLVQGSLAEAWNGSQWTRQQFPVPARSAGASLAAVSCTSAQFCEAVGTYSAAAGPDLPLAANWNGTAWRLRPVPVPTGDNFGALTTVSCVSATFCEAWGGGNAGNPGPTLAEQWNGTSWQQQAAPPGATVDSVSCVSATFCEAADAATAAAYGWNGSAWSSQAIPSPAGPLSGVSCASATFCEALSAYRSDGGLHGVAVEWDGSAWAATQDMPSPTAASDTSPQAIFCGSASTCEAVGTFDVAGNANDPKALGEAWNGSAWQLQNAAVTAMATANTLSSVSCPSDSFCMAVGQHDNSAGDVINLAEAWNGTSWHITATPDPRRPDEAVGDELLGVSCVSASFCEAVGTGPDGDSAEGWNGSSWRVQARPSPGGGDAQSVSCVSVDFCLSVDGSGDVDTWNGTAWSAGPAITGFSVGGVSCVSATHCEAVGAGPAGPDAAEWNGSTWTVQAAGGDASDGLSAVSCSAGDACDAVGFAVVDGQVDTWAEGWNGSTWTTQATPNPTGSTESSLAAVWCTGAHACTATGSSGVSGLASTTLAEVWDGTAWTLQSTPSPSTPPANVLSGVSCGAPGACTAVGQTGDRSEVATALVETGP